MDKLVLKVALEYKRALNNFGCDFSFPKADSVVNTYSYRTFNAFVNKCKSSRYDESQILEIIKIVVKYMHKNRLIRKGIGILSSPDIVDICIDELKNQIGRHDNISKAIDESNKYLNSCGMNKTEFLLKKINKKGFANFVMLRSKNILSDSFICCSKSCMTAYHKLERGDKAMMLNLKDYMILKMKMINVVGSDNIKEILGEDSNV